MTGEMRYAECVSIELRTVANIGNEAYLRVLRNFARVIIMMLYPRPLAPAELLHLVFIPISHHSRP